MSAVSVRMVVDDVSEPVGLATKFHAWSLAQARDVATVLQTHVEATMGSSHRCALLCDLLNDLLETAAMS